MSIHASQCLKTSIAARDFWLPHLYCNLSDYGDPDDHRADESDMRDPESRTAISLCGESRGPSDFNSLHYAFA